MLRKRDFVVYIANIDYYYNLLYIHVGLIILYIHVPHVPGSKNLVVLHVVRPAQVFDTANHFLLPSLIIEPLPTLY